MNPGSNPSPSPARLAFGLILAGIGALSLGQGTFGAIWQGVSPATPGREFLMAASALLSLTCGAGLLWSRTARPAAWGLTGALILWLLAFRLGSILAAPQTAALWEALGETLVITAGALVLALGAARTALSRTLLGLALLPLGLAHLLYLTATAGLIPSWIPGPPKAWAGATGLTYIAAGLALAAGWRARLTAWLVTAQMAGFTIVVWAWRLLEGVRAPGMWSEAIDSLALSVAAWIVAEALTGNHNGDGPGVGTQA